jgi:hypothetical protein
MVRALVSRSSYRVSCSRSGSVTSSVEKMRERGGVREGGAGGEDKGRRRDSAGRSSRIRISCVMLLGDKEHRVGEELRRMTISLFYG